MPRTRRVEPEPRVYVLDPSQQQVYEIGAQLLILLAFPAETSDPTLFAELYTSLCTEALIERSRTDPEWANQHQWIKPVHFCVPPAAVKANLRTMRTRVRHRLIAGHMANAIVFEAAGFNPTLPGGCESFAVGQLIKMALRDTGQFEAKNAVQRIWRPSLPAIHLCAAVQAYLQRGDNRQTGVSWGDFIFDLDAIVWIMDRVLKTQALMADRPEQFRPPRAARIVLQVKPS